MTFEQRYIFIVTDQVDAPTIAEWLRDPLFRAYYDKRQPR